MPINICCAPADKKFFKDTNQLSIYENVETEIVCQVNLFKVTMRDNQQALCRKPKASLLLTFSRNHLGHGQ